MGRYDYLVVGADLFGSVFAYEMAKRDAVLVGRRKDVKGLRGLVAKYKSTIAMLKQKKED